MIICSPDSDMDLASMISLQQSSSPESFHEKERQLSEVILKLQMYREQLLAQQEHQSKVRETQDLPECCRF